MQIRKVGQCTHIYLPRFLGNLLRTITKAKDMGKNGVLCLQIGYHADVPNSKGSMLWYLITKH